VEVLFTAVFEVGGVHVSFDLALPLTDGGLPQHVLHVFHLVFHCSVAGEVQQLAQLQRRDLLPCLSCVSEELADLTARVGSDDAAADVVREVVGVVTDHLETLESERYSFIVQLRFPHAEVQC